MAYSKKKNEETKKNATAYIDVDCVYGLENDLQISKLRFYPINKNGLLAKCTCELNGCLVLDNILIRENSKYLSTPSSAYENKDGEMIYKPHYYFIIKGVPAQFGDFILEQYKKVCDN